jgi:hypothetical protein
MDQFTHGPFFQVQAFRRTREASGNVVRASPPIRCLNRQYAPRTQYPKRLRKMLRDVFRVQVLQDFLAEYTVEQLWRELQSICAALYDGDSGLVLNSSMCRETSVPVQDRPASVRAVRTSPRPHPISSTLLPGSDSGANIPEPNLPFRIAWPRVATSAG